MIECTKCGVCKSKSSFYADKSVPRGHKSQCKVCIKAMRAARLKLINKEFDYPKVGTKLNLIYLKVSGTVELIELSYKFGSAEAFWVKFQEYEDQYFCDNGAKGDKASAWQYDN